MVVRLRPCMIMSKPPTLPSMAYDYGHARYRLQPSPSLFAFPTPPPIRFPSFPFSPFHPDPVPKKPDGNWGARQEDRPGRRESVCGRPVRGGEGGGKGARRPQVSHEVVVKRERGKRGRGGGEGGTRIMAEGGVGMGVRSQIHRRGGFLVYVLYVLCDLHTSIQFIVFCFVGVRVRVRLCVFCLVGCYVLAGEEGALQGQGMRSCAVFFGVPCGGLPRLATHEYTYALLPMTISLPIVAVCGSSLLGHVRQARFRCADDLI